MLSAVILYGLTLVLAQFVSPLPRTATTVLVPCALLLRMLASLLVPMVVVFDDEMAYDSMGTIVARSMDTPSGVEWSPNAWGSVTGVAYYVFGQSAYSMKPINAMMGVIGGLLLGQIARGAYRSRKLTWRVTSWALFLPPLVFVSSVTLKEQAVAFALTLAVWGFVKRGGFGLLISGLGCFLLAVVRANLAVAVLPLIGAHYVARASSGFVGQNRALTWGVALAVVGGVGYAALETEFIQQTTVVQILRGADTRGQEALTQSRATYARYLDAEGTSLGRNFVLAPVIALYSPSPFRAITTPEPAVFLEAACFTLLIYFATPYFVLGALESRKRNDQLVIVTVALVVFVAASLSVLTFAPESFRFRWAGLGLFFTVAAFGLEVRRPWRKQLLAGWWVSVAIFGAVYLRAFAR